ncbi:MAG: hypothetical protein K2X66_01115, partial [Cyanobacteria bacterium]|nr:hypothetical protein [Cyanobacteriota bacterium]
MIDKHYAPIGITIQYPLSVSSHFKPSYVGYGQTLRANPVDSFSPYSLRGGGSIQFQGFWSPFSRLYHRLLQKEPSKAKKIQGRAEKDFAREMKAFNTLKIQAKQLDDAISTLNGKRIKQIEGLKSVLKEREQLAFSILAMTGGTVSVTEPEAMVSEVKSKIGKMLGNPENSFLGSSDPKKGIPLLQKFKQLDAHINQAYAVIKDYEKALAELQLRSGEMSKKTAYLGYGIPKKAPPVGLDDDYLDELAKDPQIIASIFEDKLGAAAKLAADIDAIHAKKAASDAIGLGNDDNDKIFEVLSAESFAWH